MGRDFYGILGCARDADDEALKKAYKKAAIKWHPDRHANKSDQELREAEEKFKDIAYAYEVLSDKQKRAVYDQCGEEGLRAGAPAQGGDGGGRTSGFSGFGPGGVSFSYSGSGGGGGMDAMRAAQMFQQMFGAAGFGHIGAGMEGMHDPFSSLLDGGLDGRRIRRRHMERSRVDLLPNGTTVRLAGLSSSSLNGSMGRIEGYDEVKDRYVVGVADGSSIAVRPRNVLQLVADCRIVGTSKEEINGRVAASAVYDASTRRYNCEGLKHDGTVISLKPENVVLPSQTNVTIEGVQSRPALNGRVGRIEGVENDRYLVKLGPGEAVRLRFGAVAAC